MRLPDFPDKPKWGAVLRWCLAVTDPDHPDRAYLARLATETQGRNLTAAEKRRAWPVTQALKADWEAQRLPAQWRARQVTIDRLKGRSYWIEGLRP